jgi:gluconokinase
LIVVVMGVTGAGKTTAGRALAERLGWEFLDADDFHPMANVEKIRAGIALDDADREPWLQAMRAALEVRSAERINVVLACSALKSEYREKLRVGEVRFVYLRGSYAAIAERLRLRHGHFADERVLASQFADLEEPEDAVVVDAGNAVDRVVEEICRGLGIE